MHGASGRRAFLPALYIVLEKLPEIPDGSLHERAWFKDGRVPAVFAPCRYSACDASHAFARCPTLFTFYHLMSLNDTLCCNFA